MRCPDCGFENSEDAVICDLCGRSLESSDVSIFESEPLSRKPVKKVKKNKRMLAGAVIAGIIVMIAIVITFILVFGKKTPEPVPEPEPIEQIQPPAKDVEPIPEPEPPEVDIDYTLYTGAWKTGTQNAGGTSLNIKSVENGALLFDVFVFSASSEAKTASLTDVHAVCDGRTASFSFADDGWGNSGTGTLIFGTEQIGVNILITASAGRGWGIQTDCIVKRPSAQPAESDVQVPTAEGVTPPVVKTEVMLGTVNASGGLNLRKSAAADGEKIILLQDKSEVIVYGNNGDGSWLYVQYGGYIGWVSSSYITIGISLNLLTADTARTIFRPILLAYASCENGFYGAKADTSKTFSYDGIDASTACFEVSNASTVEQLDVFLRGCLADNIVDGYKISEHFIVRDGRLYVLVAPRAGAMYDGASIQLEKTLDDTYYVSADCYGEDGLYTGTTVFTVKMLNGRFKITGTDSVYQKSGMTTSAAGDEISW